MGKYFTHCTQQTTELGEKLATTLKGGQLIAFTGGMGAGKTTFCKGLAKGLGVQEEVTSPSYAIVNTYRGRLPFAHFDAWRISSAEDLEVAGFYDYLDAGAVVAVEWSENAAGFLGTPDIRIHIQSQGDDTREISIEGADGF